MGGHAKNASERPFDFRESGIAATEIAMGGVLQYLRQCFSIGVLEPGIEALIVSLRCLTLPKAK